MKYLDGIEDPWDLKKMSTLELEELAQEIRAFLINSVAVTGGHLAPNLGVVELTLALHKIFDSPTDKIIWDVGHQAYVHKIITGRRDRFGSLRQFGGISGFPKRTESVYDVFGTGHSSTSISAAVGMVLARDLAKDNYNVVAVIGDGSMTGGMSFEALNHAGMLGKNIIVILNDNEMSIAKNVGAMADYLYRMRTAPSYKRIKRDVEFILKKIPAIGERVAQTAERVKDTLKYLLVPGMLFEELGFTYIGPIDGHNIAQLEDVLENTKKMQGPILVHTVTCKGKGYLPAEKNPGKFHGIGAFHVNTGELIRHDEKPSYTSVFGMTLVDIAKMNPSVVAITAAMPDGTGLSSFAQVFPERFFDVGIAEQHAVTMAAGMASQGQKPVVAIYSTFLQRAYDQVLHDICLQKLPVVLALDRAGLVGEDGPTHHGLFDFAYLRHIPNLIIMAPKDENELRHMLYTAINSDCPVAIRYPRGSGCGVSLQEPLINLPIGRSEKIAEGEKIAILAIGSMVAAAMQTRKLLQQEGFCPAVINARFVKPLDENAIRQISKQYSVIITMEEHALAGGFGSAVLEYLNSHRFFGVKILRIGLPDSFIEHGNKQQLLDKYGFTPEKIAQSIRKFVSEHGVV